MEWNLPMMKLEDYTEHEKRILSLQFMHLILQKMQEKSINRKQLAEMMGITPNYLSSIITGKRIPSLELLTSFQYYLNIRFIVKLPPEGKIR